MAVSNCEAIKTDLIIAFEKRYPVQVITSIGDVAGYVYLGHDRETHFGLSLYKALPPVNVQMFEYNQVVQLDILFRLDQ